MFNTHATRNSLLVQNHDTLLLQQEKAQNPSAFSKKAKQVQMDTADIAALARQGHFTAPKTWSESLPYIPEIVNAPSVSRKRNRPAAVLPVPDDYFDIDNPPVFDSPQPTAKPPRRPDAGLAQFGDWF